MAVVLWLVTGSAFALLFAALGPVAALATVIDGRLGGRRARRRDRRRYAQQLVALEGHIDLLREERRRWRRDEIPSGPAVVGGEVPSGARVALGAGPAPSGIELVGVELVGTELVGTEVISEGEDPPDGIAALARRAGTLTGVPVGADPTGGIAVLAPPVIARAIIRSLRVQLDDDAAARITAVDSVVEAGDAATVLRVAGGVATLVRHPEPERRGSLLELELVSRVAVERWTSSRAGAEVVPTLPSSHPLAALLGPASDPRSRTGLDCRPAVDADGPLALDLVADGPHAIVGGTTGSGKSELLIAWVLAMAAAYPPERVSFLLVDFKGGAAFTALESLPHTVGTITDLDRGGAARALASLTAELRHRERVLLEEGVRDISASDTLPRLVIVVDEFAAMLQEHDDLHGLFVDLASRGRSLGVHLLLATQRPGGVVRDAVLANADLRICLRVNNAADSVAVLGVPDAAALDPAARGRALVGRPGTAPARVQFALASPDDVARVAEAWPGSSPPRRPWCPPLPAVVPYDSLEPVADGVLLGLLDDPEHQRRTPAVWDARAGLLILGAARSGLSTTLDTIAVSARDRMPVRWVPPTPEAAWDVVHDLAEASAPCLALLDDLDALLPRFGADHRPAFADALTRLLREGPARGVVCAITARRLTGEAAALGALLSERLLLRHATRQDHLLAGGEPSAFDPDLAPGGGSWHDLRVQVARAEAPRARPEDARIAELAASAPLAIVSSRPEALARRATLPVERLDAHPGGTAESIADLATRAVILGDVEEWQSRWGLLSGLRGRVDLVLDGLTVADVRVLTRSRVVPPPLGPGTAWRVLADGSVERVRLDW